MKQVYPTFILNTNDGSGKYVEHKNPIPHPCLLYQCHMKIYKTYRITSVL